VSVTDCCSGWSGDSCNERKFERSLRYKHKISQNLRVMVLSHWPHVAEQVPQQVAELVAELVEQHVASVKAPLFTL